MRSLVPLPLVAAPFVVAITAEAAAWTLLAISGVPAGHWYGQPRLLVLVHLLTVGAMVMPMLGAGWQLLPVLSGRPPEACEGRLAVAATGLAVVAAPLLWTGLSGRWTAGAVGAALMIAALALRSLRVLRTVWTTSGRRGIRAWLLGAEVSLWAGLALAVALLGNKLGFAWVADPIAVVGRHAALLLAGWVGGSIVGFAGLLFPMFAVAREPNDRLLLAASVPWFAGIFLGSSAVWAFGALVTAAILGSLLVRRTRSLDPGLSLAAAGTITLAAIAVAVAVGGPGPEVVVLGIVAFVLTIQRGMSMRILPFLAWAHGLSQAPRRAPPVSALLPRAAWAVVGLHGAGAATILLSPRVGATLLLAASAGQASLVVAIAARTFLARNRLSAIAGMEAH